MGTLNGIYKDVGGAPFKIGDKVKFVFRADETADGRFLNREGTVIYFEYTCGCGQTFPKDPMIGVKFVRCTKEFWKEELRLLKRPSTRSALKDQMESYLVNDRGVLLVWDGNGKFSCSPEIRSQLDFLTD